MKNKGLIITAIILLSIVAIFLIVFLIMMITGNSLKFGFIRFGSKSKNVIFDKTFELEEVENIVVKQDAGDVIIKKATDGKVQVVLYGDNKDEFRVDLKDKKLNIDYTIATQNYLVNFGSKINDIIVYLPVTYSGKIDIENDYGKCEIEDFKESSININCDAGNVEIGKIKNATIKCDYGNIEIDEILNKCDIKADCGNIDINKISIQEDSKIKADLGNVDIEKTNDIYIDSKVDLGKTSISQNNRSANITLKIECDCGNVTVGK